MGGWYRTGIDRASSPHLAFPAGGTPSESPPTESGPRPGVAARLKPPTVALLLATLAFGVYCANGRAIRQGDSIPASLIPIVLLTQGNLVMDPYADYFVRHGVRTHFFLRSRFGMVSFYPLATGLVLTPFYALPVWIYGRTHPGIEEWILFAGRAEKLSAALLASGSVALFYLLALRLAAPRGWAVALTLAFALGTEAWSTSSQALWQHGPGVLAMLLASLLAWRRAAAPTIANGLGFGTACALAVAVRPTNLVFALPVWCWSELRRPLRSGAQMAASAAAPVIIGAALVGSNLLVFGRASGGYAWQASPSWPAALRGLLWSPGRGLLVYFPLALLGLAGAVAALRRAESRRSLYVPWMLSVVAQICILAAFRSWWGGFSYGPRQLAETQPLLLLLIVPLLRREPGGAAPGSSFKALFWLFLAWSVAVQAQGALFYNGSWNAAPKSVDKAPERNWDWQDNAIARDLPKLPRLLRRAQQLLLPPRPLREWKASYEVQPRVTLDPGELRPVEILVRNRSGEPWADYGRSDGNGGLAGDLYEVHLSYHLLDAAGRVLQAEGPRSDLRRIVWPGGAAPTYALIKAPAAPGRYLVAISLVQEGVGWFDAHGVPAARLDLLVVASPGS